MEAGWVRCPVYRSTVEQVVRIIKTAGTVIEVLKVRRADESEVKPAWQELKRGARVGIDMKEDNQSFRARLEKLERKISFLEQDE